MTILESVEATNVHGKQMMLMRRLLRILGLYKMILEQLQPLLQRRFVARVF
jgi:hypothetical protein